MGTNAGHADTGHDHSPMHYVKIWAVLLVLLVISIVGPMLEIRILTLITAFGIAIVKALMVAAYFMHLNIEKRYIWYMLFTMLFAVAMFFFGVATDVMMPQGRNWKNQAAQTLIEQHSKGNGGGGDHHPAPH